jgi:hypothetical protein
MKTAASRCAALKITASAARAESQIAYLDAGLTAVFGNP